jgi:hypothetical protein
MNAAHHWRIYKQIFHNTCGKPEELEAAESGKNLDKAKVSLVL